MTFVFGDGLPIDELGRLRPVFRMLRVPFGPWQLTRANSQRGVVSTSSRLIVIALAATCLGLRVRGGRSVWECMEHVVAQRVTFSWALVCVNGFRALWLRPDVLRLNVFGRGGTGVARYRGEGVGGPH